MKSIFSPQQYAISDVANTPFICPNEIDQMLEQGRGASFIDIEQIVAKSLSKKRLSLQEVAALIGADTVQANALIFDAAKKLKRSIYGNRIVLFAPLYVGNHCSNNCSYCGFRSSNVKAVRKTLCEAELEAEVRALESVGHKRLVMVWGEHALYSPTHIADAVRKVYSISEGKTGEIRRVNINAAPLDTDGFREVREAGIGTYQIFQETYDPRLYQKYHLSGKKSDYNYRLTALDRAMDAGIDDVGIGALLGLADWRFEVMGLVRHANHLEACYGVGPHTISFPRIKAASEVEQESFLEVSDSDFMRLIAILRLAVPYAGMILTAREPDSLRREAMALGVSQIDGGTKIEIGGYAKAMQESKNSQDIGSEQFMINDERSLNEVVFQLMQGGYMPSFCTACYRKGRTGEHFMEFSTDGFIKRFCSSNALFTLAEYIEDYGDDATKVRGYKLIDETIAHLNDRIKPEVVERLKRIAHGERDLLL